MLSFVGDRGWGLLRHHCTDVPSARFLNVFLFVWLASYSFILRILRMTFPDFVPSIFLLLLSPIIYVIFHLFKITRVMFSFLTGP